jgi:hypothetical protein
VVLAVGPLSVEERQLGKREQPVPPELAAVAPELLDHRFRLGVEPLVEPVASERLLGARAELAGRQHAARKRPVDVLRVAVNHPDRGGASRREQHDDGECWHESP